MELLVPFLLFAILTLPLCCLPSGSQAASNASIDHLALLSFKALITDDPSGALSSWGRASNVSYCQWHGVTCGAQGRRGRVTALGLPGLNLSGIISPAIANLTFVTSLDLSYNNLDGEIPPSLSRCSNLRNLSLGFNNLQGKRNLHMLVVFILLSF